MAGSPAYRYLAVCPRGVERELHDELRELGLGSGFEVDTLETLPGGVRFGGSLADGYRASFASFLASRVLVEVARFELSDEESLYAALRRVDWAEHMKVSQSFRLDVASSASQTWIARKFALQRAKDALVDSFREKFRSRPDVDRDDPDLRFHLFVGKQEVALSIDLGVQSLHRRGLPRKVGRSVAAAPLKESLAAAVLRFGGWHLHEPSSYPPLLDPMCGSGTLLLEAVSMATGWVPGLRRQDREPQGWIQHDVAAWREVRKAFVDRHAERCAPYKDARSEKLQIFAFDSSPEALDQARHAFRSFGGQGCSLSFERGVVFRNAALEDLSSPTAEPGLLVTNPPYGERLLERAAALALHETLGDRMRCELLGWRAAVLTEQSLVSCIGLRSRAKHPVYNGPIDCRVVLFDISKEAPKTSSPGWKKKSPSADMLSNRLRKKLKSLRPWAEEQGTDCYRIYDRDIPEFPVTIDRLGNTVVVYDRSRPNRSAGEDLQRLRDLRVSLTELIPKAKIVFKTRDAGSIEERSRVPEGRELARERVKENGLSFWVNHKDYLDYGLFLDERKLRKRIRKEAKGKSFLNLFSYTCSASVYAAVGGASKCVSVDLSSTYLAWGEENFALNDINRGDHAFLRQDAFRFLENSRAKSFDLIYAGPPIDSVSKRASSFSLRDDGPEFFRLVLRLLRPGGAFYFSSPIPNIEAESWVSKAKVQEITRETTPRDFAKTTGVRRSWRITLS